ncbi:MAG: DNRLRE domain-containing protein [Chloroflexota bacterium]|nr:DNRLRE domain-containing protein [Chloroflexota bacterium]
MKQKRWFMAFISIWTIVALLLPDVARAVSPPRLTPAVPERPAPTTTLPPWWTPASHSQPAKVAVVPAPDIPIAIRAGRLLFAPSIDADDDPASNPVAGIPVPVIDLAGQVGGIVALAVQLEPDVPETIPVGVPVTFRVWNDQGVQFERTVRSDAWGAASAETTLRDVGVEYAYQASAPGYGETEVRHFRFDPAQAGYTLHLDGAHIWYWRNGPGRVLFTLRSPVPLDAGRDEATLLIMRRPADERAWKGAGEDENLLQPMFEAVDEAGLGLPFPPVAMRVVGAYTATVEVQLPPGDYGFLGSLAVNTRQAEHFYSQPIHLEVAQGAAPPSAGPVWASPLEHEPGRTLAQYRAPAGRAIFDLVDTDQLPWPGDAWEGENLFVKTWRTGPFEWREEQYEITIETRVDDGKKVVSLAGFDYDPIQRRYTLAIRSLQEETISDTLRVDVFGPGGVVIKQEERRVVLEPGRVLRYSVEVPAELGQPEGLRVVLDDPLDAFVNDLVATTRRVVSAVREHGSVVAETKGYIKVLGYELLSVTYVQPPGTGYVNFFPSKDLEDLVWDFIKSSLDAGGLVLGSVGIEHSINILADFTLDTGSCPPEANLEEVKTQLKELAKGLDVIVGNLKLESPPIDTPPVPVWWILQAWLSVSFGVRGTVAAQDLTISIGAKAYAGLTGHVGIKWDWWGDDKYLQALWKVIESTRALADAVRAIDSLKLALDNCDLNPPDRRPPDDRQDVWRGIESFYEGQTDDGTIDNLVGLIERAQAQNLWRAERLLTLRLREAELARFGSDVGNLDDYLDDANKTLIASRDDIQGLISGTLPISPSQTLTEALVVRMEQTTAELDALPYAQDVQQLVDAVDVAQRLYLALQGEELELQHELRQLFLADAVGVLASGFAGATLSALAEVGLPAQLVSPWPASGEFGGRPAPYLSPDLAPRALVVPAGGLHGIAGSPEAREWLEAYVAGGGLLIAFTQMLGEDWAALPGGQVAGVGYEEDQRCQHASVQAAARSDWLVWMGIERPDIQVDGAFTAWPNDAKVLLLRTQGAYAGYPAMIEYPYGAGKVLATSAYGDWAWQAGSWWGDDWQLTRSLLLRAWLLAQGRDVGDPDLPVAEPASTITVAFPLTNTGAFTVTRAKVEIPIIYGWRTGAYIVHVPLALAPVAGTVLTVTMPTPRVMRGVHDWTQIGLYRLKVTMQPVRGGSYMTWGPVIYVRSPVIPPELAGELRVENNPANLFQRVAVTATAQNYTGVTRTVTVQGEHDLPAEPVTLTVPPDDYAEHVYTVRMDGSKDVSVHFDADVDIWPNQASAHIGIDYPLLQVTSPPTLSDGETILLRVTNQGEEAVLSGAVALTLTAPSGTPVWTAAQALPPLAVGQTVTPTFSLPPLKIEFGTYHLRYRVDDGRGRSRVTDVSLPARAATRLTLDRSSYRVREPLTLTVNVNNSGYFDLEPLLELSAPDAGWSYTQPLTLPAGTEWSGDYTFTLPESLESGSHAVHAALCLGSAVTQTSSFHVPPADVREWANEGGLYLAGQSLPVTLTNSGGVDAVVAYKLSLKRGLWQHGILLKEDLDGTLVSAGGTTVITANIPITLTSGYYYLVLKRQDKSLWSAWRVRILGTDVQAQADYGPHIAGTSLPVTLTNAGGVDSVVTYTLTLGDLSLAEDLSGTPVAAGESVIIAGSLPITLPSGSYRLELDGWDTVGERAVAREWWVHVLGTDVQVHVDDGPHQADASLPVTLTNAGGVSTTVTYTLSLDASFFGEHIHVVIGKDLGGTPVAAGESVVVTGSIPITLPSGIYWFELDGWDTVGDRPVHMGREVSIWGSEVQAEASYGPHQAGAPVTATLSNVGSVDVVVTYTWALQDRHGAEFFLGQDLAGTPIPAGEEVTISGNVPAGAASGIYRLQLNGQYTPGNWPVSWNRLVEVSGPEIAMTARTDREMYLTADDITVSARLTNTGTLLPESELELAIVRDTLESEIQWENYDEENAGLYCNYITAVEVDAQGDIWLGSEDAWGYGSVYVDCLRADLTTVDSFDLYGALGYANQMNDIASDNTGRTWFATNNGVAVLSADESSWTVYQRGGGSSNPADNFVNAVVVDEEGNAWFGTEGGANKLTGDGEWSTYTTGNSGLVNDHVNAVAVDRDGSVWFGTDGGLNKLIPDGEIWFTYTGGLPTNGVVDIAFDAEGNVWLAASSSGGVSALRADGSAWVTYTTSNSPLVSPYVSAIAVDGDDRKWIGYYNDGISVLSADGSTWEHYSHDTVLNSNIIADIALAPNNDVWLATKYRVLMEREKRVRGMAAPVSVPLLNGQPGGATRAYRGWNIGEILWTRELTVSLGSPDVFDDVSSLAASSLNATGQLALHAVLTSTTGQVLARDHYPFYVFPTRVGLTLDADRQVYAPGRALVATGALVNDSDLTLYDRWITVTLDGEVIYTAGPFDLAAGDSYPYVATGNVSLDEGLVVLEASSPLVTVNQAVRVSAQVGEAALLAPDVAGREPFSATVVVTNTGETDAFVRVSIAGQQETGWLELSPGQSVEVSHSLSISADAVLTATVRGDIEYDLSQLVAWGEGAALALLPPDTEVGGLIAVPCVLYGTGALSTPVSLHYRLDAGPVLSQSHTLWPGQVFTVALLLDLDAGPHTLAAELRDRDDRLLHQDGLSLELLPAGEPLEPHLRLLGVSVAPTPVVAGDAVSVTLEIANDGPPGLAIAGLQAFEPEQQRIITPAGWLTQTFAFSLDVPADVPAGPYIGQASLDEQSQPFFLDVVGTDIDLSIALDQPWYLAGDVISLTVTLTENAGLSGDYTLSPHYLYFEDYVTVTVPAWDVVQHTFVFTATESDRASMIMAHAPTPEYGQRIIMIDSLPVTVVDPSHGAYLVHDKPVYYAGETIYMTVTVTGTLGNLIVMGPMELALQDSGFLIWSPSFDEEGMGLVITGTYPLSYTLPAEMRSGRYTLRLLIDGQPRDYAVDVHGWLVTSRRATLDRVRYAQQDTLSAEVEFFNETGLPINDLRLSAWIAPPGGEQGMLLTPPVSRTVDLRPGLNVFTVTGAFTTSHVGQHRLLVNLGPGCCGWRVAGAAAQFDVGWAHLVELTTDHGGYAPGEPGTGRLDAYGYGPTHLVVTATNGATLLDQTPDLFGFSTLTFSIPTTPTGDYLLVAHSTDQNGGVDSLVRAYAVPGPRDAQPPQLTLTYPNTDTIITTAAPTSTIIVTGNASDDSGEVTVLVNGQVVTPTAGGDFSLPLEVRQGFNLVSATALDPVGNVTYTSMVGVYLIPARGLTLSADRTAAAPGERVTFQAVLTTSGVLSDAVLIQSLPSDVVTDVVAWASSGETDVGNLNPDLYNVTWQGDLGGTYPVTLTVKATLQAGGLLTQTATVYWGWGLIQESNELTIEIGSLACELYPIALHADTLAGAEIGQELEDIYQGNDPGEFGWLSWTGDPYMATLVQSLTPPGDSHTYVNPHDPTDDEVSTCDWVQGRPGIVNISSIRNALDTLEMMDFVVPVWDAAEGSGYDVSYRVTNFAWVRITDYHLRYRDRISIRFLGYTSCGMDGCGATIGDVVWNDLDGDGVQDAEEPGIGDVQVMLFESDGDSVFEPEEEDPLVDYVFTGSDGSYDFISLDAGTYWVTVYDESVPEGYVPTTDSGRLLVTVAAGQNLDAADFGYRELSGSTCVTIQRPDHTHEEVLDAYILSATPDYNGGDWLKLYTGQIVYGERQSLLRFDLSGVPADAVVDSATFGIYLRTCHGQIVRAHRITTPWEETTVTWNTFGNGFAGDTEGFLIGRGIGFHYIDLTELVQGWLDGTYENYGVLLEQNLNTYNSYKSSEYCPACCRPKLEVCYHVPDGQ